VGVDFHKVCKCGSYHSEYTVRGETRVCRSCGAVLSVHGEFTENSPCFGMTTEEVRAYMNSNDIEREQKILRIQCADRAIAYGLKSGMFRKPDCDYALGLRRAIENE
jgi:hypothetical protein